MPDAAIHIFGVRHHGPGSSRAVRRALEELRPDCVLIEGPPDAAEVLSLAASEDMTPPVAILIHEVNRPQNAVYYPFAEFSPEWVAIRWALGAKVSVRFIDLPQSHRMAIEAERLAAMVEAAKSAAGSKEEESEDGAEERAAKIAPPPPSMTPPENPVVSDPLGQLARAAGYDDGERWWEHVVEHRRDGGIDVFAAIREAMEELRKTESRPAAAIDSDEPLREAWMRRCIREARADAFERIAVVCGAWHAPALDVEAFKKKDDDALLKSLAKTRTAATWIPWTYDRLTFASGYGAGVRSPGWYDHLWHAPDAPIERWMTRVAWLLREKDIDCSSAHVIEATRLCHALGSFRGRALADLSDIADATRAVFFSDSDLPMRLIDRELLVGVRIGEVPEDTPMAPLVADLARQQKRLRLKPEALEKTLDLDLRNENDRERSHLLHRLRLMGVNWGTPAPESSSGKGTFHEIWQLRWEPGFTIGLIEAGVFGNTIEQAAAGRLAKLAAESHDLPALAALLQDAMLAELGQAVSQLVRRIEDVSALAGDVALLMQTLPQLARVLRYGNVRQGDQSMVRHIVNGIVPRVAAGLPGAVSTLNDDAAVEMEGHIRATSGAIELLESPEHSAAWTQCLLRVADSDSVHGLIRGRCTRILFDAGTVDSDEVGRRLSLALSPGADPAQSARWVEGFLSGSGLLLVHDARLLGIIDRWVAQIPAQIFEELIPLLRRTFATFPRPERRQIGQAVASSDGAGATGIGAKTAATDRSIDPARGAAAFPLLLKILGGKP